MKRHVSALTILTLSLIGLRQFETFAQAQTASRQVFSLDGTWEIIFDPENVGREAGWHRAETFSSMAGRRTIDVPSCWELIEKDYEGVAFYRRTFQVPAELERESRPSALRRGELPVRSLVERHGRGCSRGRLHAVRVSRRRSAEVRRGKHADPARGRPDPAAGQAGGRHGADGDSAMARRDHRRHLAAGPTDRHRRCLREGRFHRTENLRQHRNVPPGAGACGRKDHTRPGRNRSPLRQPARSSRGNA